MMKSIEQIHEDLKQRGHDLPPAIVKEYLITLAVSQSYMGREYAMAKQEAYKMKQGLFLDPKMTDSKAETLMKASDAYRVYMEKEREYDALVELIRVLKIVGKLNELEKENEGHLGG